MLIWNELENAGTPRTLYWAAYVLALGYRIHTHEDGPRVVYMETTEQASTHPKYWSTSRVRLGKYDCTCAQSTGTTHLLVHAKYNTRTI